MASCPDCGASTGDDDRYCAACGAAQPGEIGDATAAGWAGGESAPLDEVELLGLGSRPLGAAARGGATGGAGPARRRPPRVWLALAAAGLAVGVGAWAVGRAGSDVDSTGSAPASTETAGSAPTEASDTATSEAPAGADGSASATDGTSADGSADEYADDAANGGGDTTAVASDAGPTVAPEATGPTGEAVDGSGAGPVLGRPIGWSLLIGMPSGGDLTRIDLDTGEERRYDVEGGPMLVDGGRLILHRRSDSGETISLSIVPVADPEADGIELPVGELDFGFGPPMAAAADGTVWVYASSFGGSSSWRLIRLRDGAVLDEVGAPMVFLAPPVAGAGPEVVSSGAGGVYRRRGDGYQLVAPGTPVAVHQGAVLTRSCAGPGACRLQWLDVGTGQPVERTVPPAESHLTWVGVADAAGRFLVGRQHPDGGLPYDADLALFDLARNRPVTLPRIDYQVGVVGATPDGGYLAVQDEDGIQVYDADQQRWFPVPVPTTGTVNIVFVRNGAA